MAGRATRGRGMGSSTISESDRPTRGRGRGSFAPISTIPDGVKEVHGEGGSSIKLLSNYYRLSTPKDAIIHAYRVDFEPPVESTRMRRALIYDIRETFGAAYVFDGGNEIKSLKKLSSEMTKSATRKSDNALISISIRHTSTVTWGHPEMMRLYNTQMKRNLQNIGMMQIGRNYYDKNQRKSLPKWKIEVWPGIVTAINEHDGGILMVNNIIHKVVRLGTAHDLLQDLLRSDKDRFQANARKELPGKVVMVKYNNKTYRIDDIVFDKNPITYTFERRGQTISLKDYYKEQYNEIIKDEKQPLLLVKPTERDKRGGKNDNIMLIPELCLMTGFTDQMRNNFDLKKEMEGITSTTPVGRVSALTAFIRKLSGNENVRKEMSAWKLAFEPNIIELPGRILPPEKILMHGDAEKSGTPYYQKSGSFENEIRSKNLRKAVGMDSWAIVCLRNDKQLIDEYCSTLRQVAGPLGVNFAAPKIFTLENDRTSTYVEGCKKVHASCKMVNIIVPNNNKDRYDAIKKIFCCESPRASQVVTTKVLNKKNALRTICTKICIQMSVKLGAEAWALHIPVRKRFLQSKFFQRVLESFDHLRGIIVLQASIFHSCHYFSAQKYDDRWL